jgi:hypothetical protein
MKLKITEEQFKIVVNFLKEEIIDGSGRDPWKYKKEGDSYFAAKKGSDNWIKASGRSKDSIKSNIFGIVTDKEKDEDEKIIKKDEKIIKKDDKIIKKDGKKPKTYNEIISFQTFAKNKGFKNVVGKYKRQLISADGSWGDNSEAAWNIYGSTYNPSDVKKDEKIVSDKTPGKTISRGDAWGMNTHVGIVGAIKNGTPIIFHNIHGNVYADPKGLIQGGGKVVWVRRSIDSGKLIGDGVKILSTISGAFYVMVLANIKKISSSKSVLMFTIPQEQCAQFVNDFENSSRTSGGVGDAWLAHNNRSLGSLSYTAFEGLSSSDSNSIINLWQKIHNNGGGEKNGDYKGEAKTLISKIASKSSSPNLQLGDIVGIYYPPSSYHELAFYNGGEVYFT